MFSLDFLINALSLGSLYALIALGLVIVYGILKLVNFAYGELIMVGGYVLFMLGGMPGLPWLVMAFIAILMAMLTSYLTERVAFRPVREKSLTAMLITSFAVSTLLQNAALLIVSPRSRAVQFPSIFSASIQIGNLDVPARNILVIVISTLLLVALSILLKRTILGIALRAAADNFQITRMLGVPANFNHFSSLHYQRIVCWCCIFILDREIRFSNTYDWFIPTSNSICGNGHRWHE